MKKKIALATTALVLSAGFAAAPATAAPANAGAACAQQGIGFLKEAGLLQAAAQKQIDYSTLADPVSGPIFTTLPAGSNLSLGQVVKLHTESPSLFAWCR
ncbi:hypothetical protein [Actinotalea sp. Marseille-Q4924]|uniref:hypothetical protein n=1 Tax=Actinotalea sp. Marseille-Q4924 TaxID=2866571 RepID=UPI001CE3E787|nr:hypothetical protein [Actinotalea sp. Marseille-Q4924]